MQRSQSSDCSRAKIAYRLGFPEHSNIPWLREHDKPTSRTVCPRGCHVKPDNVAGMVSKKAERNKIRKTNASVSPALTHPLERMFSLVVGELLPSPWPMQLAESLLSVYMSSSPLIQRGDSFLRSTTRRIHVSYELNTFDRRRLTEGSQGWTGEVEPSPLRRSGRLERYMCDKSRSPKLREVIDS